MCGIIGIHYFDPSRKVTTEELVTMADHIVHRGPDDAGYHTDGPIGIGMRRLSIIDIEGGHQPIQTDDCRQTIVFNGEVYNFREERTELEKQGHTFTTHTDTEVVLHLYQQYGQSFLDHMNGMFGLAIHDKNEHSLLLARDRIGIKPLYYYQDQDKLVFASEIKAILAHPEVSTELDREGLVAYLRYGFTPAPYTLYKNIHKLPPAHLLQIKGRDVTIREYWRLSHADKFTTSEETIAEELYELLKSAVDYQMIADVPLGAFLSSGIDSSGIVHLMHEQGADPVSTYSIGFGKGYEQYNELDGARRFAQDYHTNHHEIVVTPDVAELFPRLIAQLDEPLADSSFLVTYLVSELASKTVKVILSGVGGDELFGGYRRYLNVTLDGYVRHIPKWLRHGLIDPLLEAMPVDRNSRILNYARLAKTYMRSADLQPAAQYAAYTTLFDNELIRDLLDDPPEIEDYHSRYFDECDSDDLLDKLTYFDLKTSLPEQLLMLTDKMTMATSLEARVPYLDHRVVEFAARIPQKYKINGFKLRGIQKCMLKGHLPDYVFEQKKKGFGAPVGNWFRKDLKPMLDELISVDRLARQNILRPEMIMDIVTTHTSKHEDHTDHLLGLIGFQVWC